MTAASQPPAARDAGVGELLPCLFCGSVDGPDLVGSWAGGPPRHYVSCDTCDAAGPSGATEADAVAAWNRRAPLPPAAPLSAADEAKIAEAITRRPPPLTLPPAAVDAGMTEAEAFALVTAYDAAGDATEREIEDDELGPIEDPSPLARIAARMAEATRRVDAWRDIRVRLIRALATAAQPARAVPDRAEVDDGMAALVFASASFNGQEIVRKKAALLATIYGDAPADASEAVRDGE